MRPRSLALALALALTTLAGAAWAQGLPAGHPPTDEDEAPPSQQSPHGAHGGVPGAFEPPQDTAVDDPALPPGTIAVDLRDPDDKPVAGEAITLGILQQSVAKGENREHKAQQTDGSGRAVFAGLQSGSGIAYRISVVKAGTP
jgi:hypothetical protein